MAATLAWPAPRIVRPYAVVEFRAMASPCRIVTDSSDLAHAGEAFVHDLERRWSRFIPSSEVSAVNAARGSLVLVSDLTALLFERAEQARLATVGAFNPLMLDRLELLGYGSQSAFLGSSSSDGPVSNESIVVLSEVSAVRLPSGRRFDPGGIGKGLAGDLVLEYLLARGAESVQIELGGDVRMAGSNWTGSSWSVDVLDPRDRHEVITRLELNEGAVATSSVLGRRWKVGDRELHHLLDPNTGQPSRTDVISVTATSSELWWAEVVAKAALLAGSLRAPSVMRRHGCSGVVLDRAGTLVSVTEHAPADLALSSLHLEVDR